MARYLRSFCLSIPYIFQKYPLEAIPPQSQSVPRVLPDTDARKELFEIELCKRPHEEIDIERVVKLTNGYSSSDISYIVKECARCSFDESVKQKQMVKISQIMLEQTIAETRPSVTSEELRQFEQTKDSFTKGHPQERPRIGFK